jgi:hypothetical protein
VIKLIDFLKVYNFRYYNKNLEPNNDDIYNCKSVRLYYDENIKNNWIEIGINDWIGYQGKISILKNTIKEQILNMYVYSFSYNDDIYSLEIYLTANKDFCFD